MRIGSKSFMRTGGVSVIAKAGGIGRVPHVRPSVRGPKRRDTAPRPLSVHRLADSYQLGFSRACLIWTSLTFQRPRSATLRAGSSGCRSMSRSIYDDWYESASRCRESDRWAAPVFLGPGTLGRTWGTRHFPSTLPWPTLGDEDDPSLFAFSVPGFFNPG
jgi:hypothetical protein